MAQKTFLIIDGHAVIYRAYYGYPGFTTPEGFLVNAVYGFSKILLTAIRNFEPDYIAVSFDLPKPTFRHKKYKEYKANRSKMPDDLQPQIPIIKEVVEALNIPKFEMEGYEADDLIGTIAKHLENGQNNFAKNTPSKKDQDILTVIVTGDQDSFQLVTDKTHVWLPARSKTQHDKEYEAIDVKDKIGVTPEQVVDLKALMGDSSDNIPGIKGVGPKTAIKLITEFNTLEKIYKFLEEKLGDLDEAKKIAQESLDQKSSKKIFPDFVHPVLKGAILKKVLADRENAFMSQMLATIDCDVPLEVELESCIVTNYDKQKASDLFMRYDFKSLLHLLPSDEFESSVQDALF